MNIICIYWDQERSDLMHANPVTELAGHSVTVAYDLASVPSIMRNSLLTGLADIILSDISVPLVYGDTEPHEKILEVLGRYAREGLVRGVGYFVAGEIHTVLCGSNPHGESMIMSDETITVNEGGSPVVFTTTCGSALKNRKWSDLLALVISEIK